MGRWVESRADGRIGRWVEECIGKNVMRVGRWVALRQVEDGSEKGMQWVDEMYR